MRDLRDETKDATLLDRAGDFILAHPYISATIIVLAEIIVMAAFVHFTDFK